MCLSYAVRGRVFSVGRTLEIRPAAQNFGKICVDTAYPGDYHTDEGGGIGRRRRPELHGQLSFWNVSVKLVGLPLIAVYHFGKERVCAI